MRRSGDVDPLVPVRSVDRVARRSHRRARPAQLRPVRAPHGPAVGAQRMAPGGSAQPSRAGRSRPRRDSPADPLARAGCAGNLSPHARCPGLPDAVGPDQAGVGIGQAAMAWAVTWVVGNIVGAAIVIGDRVLVGRPTPGAGWLMLAGRRPLDADARGHVGAQRSVPPRRRATEAGRSRLREDYGCVSVDRPRRCARRRPVATGPAAARLLAAGARLAGHVQPHDEIERNARDLYDRAHGGWLVGARRRRGRRRPVRGGADVPRSAAGRVRRVASTRPSPSWSWRRSSHSSTSAGSSSPGCSSSGWCSGVCALRTRPPGDEHRRAHGVQRHRPGAGGLRL